MTRDELRQAGYEVSPDTWRQLAGFVDALRDENRHLNLTAAQDAAELWRRHVCDSLALVPALPVGPLELLDLGSGGGLPGVPVAVVRSDVRVTLLEATAKKVAAVGRIVVRLGLKNVVRLSGRAETLAHDARYREQFDAVTARAVAPLAVLLEYAAGFLRTGGQGWLYKTTAAADEEIPAAESALRRCQLRWLPMRSYCLPGEDRPRVLVGCEKLAPLPADLPRGPGRARKRPL